MSKPSEAAGPERPAQHGVIHDIGYRHYTGPRLGRRHIARALFLDSAKGAFGLGRPTRSKVMPMILLGAICLPAFIISVIASIDDAVTEPTPYTSYVNNAQLLIMIFVAGQAPASVSRDLRFRVMALYFSRPLHRFDYVLAKFAAMATALFVLMALPLTILFAGALLAKLPVGEQVPNYVRSLAGAVLVALVLSGLGLVVASLTPKRGAGVAAVIAVLVILIGVQGTVESIATEEGSDTIAGYSGLISPFSLVDGVQHGLLGASSELLVHPPGTGGALVFLVGIVLVVAACLAALHLRYQTVKI